MEIIEKIRGLVSSYIEEQGAELVEIQYRREGGNMVLRFLVDKPGGIKLSECETLNNTLSEALDKEDTIQDSYILEVSSPGLDRPIKTDNDFRRVMGKGLEITTCEAIDGKRAHEGKLVGINEESIVIQSRGLSTVIPRVKIAKAIQKVEF